MMNDTFDDFTFSDIQNDLSISRISHPLIITKPSLDVKNEPSNYEYSTQLMAKNEISFDDSLFFSSPDFSVLNARGELLNDVEDDKNLQEQQNSNKPTQNGTISRLDGISVDLKESFKESDESTADIRLHLSEDSSDLSTVEENKDNHKLSTWGLPESILEKYESRNITTMFQWQVECLNNEKVLKNNANLVYSAPTSAGKTLVAEILAIKTVLERGKKVVFILPFVSVVREKMFYFQDIFSSSGVRVEGFMGSYNPPGGFQSVQVAICTIEKANNLINKLLQEADLSEIGAVVIDEMHLLGDPGRGYLLELLLTKLRYISLRDRNVNIQIVGMSATLPNLEILAKWLEAELYVTAFRPIPLYEQALVCGEVYDNELKLQRQLAAMPELGVDTDNILQLCIETISESCSVLIFCPTKNWCENLAQQISVAFWKLGNSKTDTSQQLRRQLKPELIVELLEQLKFCPVGLDEVLRKTVSFGVAFHHAGLTLDERDIIEGAFRNGIVRVLVATSTLSSGVNLPARRVIIRTPIFHGKPLDILTYRQMIGRAGRMGKDTAGESILVCQKNDYKIAKALMSEKLPPIESCLEGEGKLKRAILEIVASGVASSPEDVELFTKCTLLAQNETFEDPIEEALKFLITNEFIRLQELDGVKKYVATSLGKACLSSSIPPEDGLSLFTELEKARQCFVLETELHLIYLVTPYSACHQWGNLDWMFYLNLWEKLPTSMKKVGELVGVRESYIVSATRGKLQTNTSKLYHKLLVHKRFFVALALQDLVNEKPLSEVCLKFSCNRGTLQSLQLSASTFAGMVTAFSKQLGWSTVEILISQFQDRLHFGVSRDLLDLMRLPLLNGKSARALFNGGLETLVQLANSDVVTIENILHKVMPFESSKIREGETEFDLKERNKLKNIWITGKQGLTEREAAELLLTSARNYLQIEMGLKEAKWDKSGQLDADDSGIVKNSHIEKERNVDFNISNTSDNIFSPPSGTNRNNITSDGSLYCNIKNSSGNLNSSGDFVTTSQDESCMSLVENTPNSSRKRSRRHENNFSLLLEQSPRKKTKLATISQNGQLIKETIDINQIEIVDVCSHEELFSTFCKEAKQQRRFSFAVACSEAEEKKATIGVTDSNAEDTVPDKFTHKNRKVDGFAVFWGGFTVYYLSLTKMEKCVDFVRSLAINKDASVKMFDCKEQIKVLKNCCEVEFHAKIEDPKLGDWILEPEEKEKNLQALVNSHQILAYCPKMVNVSHLCGVNKGNGSPALDISSVVESKLRSSIESLLTWYLVKSVKDELRRQNPNLLNVYATEMTCLRILAKMELVGLGTNKKALHKLVDTINKEKSILERKAYGLAGRRFSFTSSKDVARVLGFVKSRKVSTKRQILEKNDNPISVLVLQWRKLNTTMTKMVQPLIRSVENGRVHGRCIVHTVTGRISMHEPNLQNVAKNFEVGGKIAISCRNAFVPEEGCVFVSADYCQLELRLLAHLSRDKLLCKIMRGKGDVFRSVAAKWNNIGENEVTDNLRQHAKQICYGIIYGMGSKALAEQLSIEEKDATMFMETFRKTYPGVKNYVKEVVDQCRENGFVETIAGRRRYLSHINHRNVAIRSQAERQAVNTTIQGSAADVVKNTMVELEKKCSSMKELPNLVLHLHDELLYEVPKNSLKAFALTLKKTMEESVKLSIPFPVKLKSGPSWGQLTEYK
ncbi:DNA polymerase theta, partial [Asbolus verrucosus]